MDIFIKLLIAVSFFFFTVGLLGKSSKVYVAIMFNKTNDDQNIFVLGSYRKRETAESKIYQYIHNNGYKESKVVECLVNKDNI